jgi:membrane protease YdiL (CAAX protease family)
VVCCNYILKAHRPKVKFAKGESRRGDCLDDVWLGVYETFAFLVVYVAFLMFVYKVDPRFSLKYKKIPTFYYLLSISTLGTAILLLPLIFFNLFLGQNLFTIFSIDRISFTEYDILSGLLAGFALFLLLMFFESLISAVRRKFFPTYRSKREEEVKKLVFGSLPKSQKQMFALLSITSLKAAIFEELIFRGYLFSNLLLLFSPPIAMIVQAVFFFIGHLYQGIFNAILPLIYGLMLGLVFFLAGSLTVVMTAHFIGDMIGLITQATLLSKKR